MSAAKYVEIDTELLLLAANGGDRNRVEVYERLRAMTKPQRRALRNALIRLDDALDDVIIEERLAESKPRKEGDEHADNA